MTITVASLLPPLIGGVLIGLSAVMLMGLTGRIAGISGMVGRLVALQPAPGIGDAGAFILGLLLAPLLAPMAAPAATAGVATMALAGLLVGVGVALGGGCTSGHGVCGLARMSPRSMVAVATFMAVAIAVVALRRAAGLLP